MCPQNAGNAVSESQNSKNFWGTMPSDPLQLCRHYGLPLTKLLATLLVKHTTGIRVGLPVGRIARSCSQSDFRN